MSSNRANSSSTLSKHNLTNHPPSLYNAKSLFPKLDHLKVESEIHMLCITETQTSSQFLASNCCVLMGTGTEGVPFDVCFCVYNIILYIVISWHSSDMPMHGAPAIALYLSACHQPPAYWLTLIANSCWTLLLCGITVDGCFNHRVVITLVAWLLLVCQLRLFPPQWLTVIANSSIYTLCVPQSMVTLVAWLLLVWKANN